MKNIVFIILAFLLIESCVTPKNINLCQYTIVITDEIIELTENKNIIWLSSYQGVEHKELKDKISMAGLPIDFTLSEENLRQIVFDKICWINNKKLDSVIFFNLENNNKLVYRLKYIQVSKR